MRENDENTGINPLPNRKATTMTETNDKGEYKDKVKYKDKEKYR